MPTRNAVLTVDVHFSVTNDDTGFPHGLFVEFGEYGPRLMTWVDGKAAPVAGATYLCHTTIGQERNPE